MGVQVGRHRLLLTERGVADAIIAITVRSARTP